MKSYEETTYGESIAGVYDELYAHYDPASIDLLAELAMDGPALELGIGTGRIALPLSEKGVAVHGIDVSEAMIAKLRAKPGGVEIELTTGSFARFKIDRRFKLIYVVFNTFFALLTQAKQVQCFKTVSEHLSSEGIFLIEAFVPDLCRFTDHQSVRTVQLSDQDASLDVSQVDPVTQQVTTQHIFLSSQGTRMYPVRLRYAWPSELDLMAQIAGFSLQHRWGSWHRQAFTKDSQMHISIYSQPRKE